VAIGAALHKTHGLPGALTFLHLNDRVMDTRDRGRNAVGRFTMELAALAIARHDLQSVYLYPDGSPSGRKPPAWPGQPLTPCRPHLRLAFRQDPVSFILAVADQVQSYGRFSADFKAITDPPPPNAPELDSSTTSVPAAPAQVGPASTSRSRTGATAAGSTRMHFVERIAACHLEYSSDGSRLHIAARYQGEAHLTDAYRQHTEFRPQEQANLFDPAVGYLDAGSLFERITLGVEYVL
jgi:hypothetical protein